MKSFSIKTLLFFLPIILTIIIIEILLINAENSYSYKHNYLKNNNKEIENLIFGSSYAYYGLNPDNFNDNTFNLANASQSIYFHNILLKQYIDQLPKLKTIIINISYSSLSRKRSQETWRKFYYHHYMEADIDIIPKPSLGNYLIFGGIGLKPSLKMIWKSYIKKQKKNKGWQPLKANQHKWGKKSAIKQENNSIDFTQNITLLQEMIDICKERKINVILLTMPVYYTYSENINEKKISKIFKSCEELEIANENTFYLNYFYNKKFELTDYFDEHHLSSEGALKMSNIINEELIKIQLNQLEQ